MIALNAGQKHLVISSAITVTGPKAGILPWYLASGVTPLAAYQAKGAASQAASYINLVNPGTYDLVPASGTPTWNTLTGWAGFLADTCNLGTGIIPAAGWSAFCQFSSCSNDGVLWGSFTTATTRFALNNFKGATNAVYYQNGGFVGPIAPALTAGNLGFAGQQGYRNGVADGGAIPAWSGVSTNAIQIGAQGNATQTNGTIIAVIIFNSTLTPAQVGLLVTAMAAL